MVIEARVGFVEEEELVVLMGEAVEALGSGERGMYCLALM